MHKSARILSRAAADARHRYARFAQPHRLEFDGLIRFAIIVLRHVGRLDIAEDEKPIQDIGDEFVLDVLRIA